jgi:hypothetical protein
MIFVMNRYQERLKFSFSSIGVLILFIVIIVVTVLSIYKKPWPSDSQAEIDRIRAELPLARGRWESHGFTDYDVNFNVFVEPGCQVKNLTLHVRNEKLVSMPSLDETACGVDIKTLDQWFMGIEYSLSQINPKEHYLHIDFEPTFGFMTRYEMKSTYLRSTQFLSVTFDNFRPISVE